MSSDIGPFSMNINYKMTGKHIDYDGGSTLAKSTDIVDVNFSKNLFGSVFSLNVTNLFNERYEQPLTYSKDGRQLRIGYKKTY